MQKEKLKTFQVDGDRFTVPYHFDERSDIFIGQFPSFEEEPRNTPNGRPWKNAVSIGCPYAAGDYDDCGSCPYLVKANPQDIIGVCFHERLRSSASPEASDPSGETTHRQKQAEDQLVQRGGNIALHQAGLPQKPAHKQHHQQGKHDFQGYLKLRHGIAAFLI